MSLSESLAQGSLLFCCQRYWTMLSPIFISAPSPGLSFLGIMRGFQLAIVGVIQGIKNPLLKILSRQDHFRRLILDFIIIEVIIGIPAISLWTTVNFVSFFKLKDYSNMYRTIEYVMYDVVGVNFILLSLMSVLRLYKSDDRLFYDSLNYFDPKFSQRLLDLQPPGQITELPVYSPKQRLLSPFDYIIDRLESSGLIECNDQNKMTIRIYTKLMVNNSIMGILFSFPKFGHVVSLLIMLQSLINVVSVTSSLLITLALWNLSPEYTIYLIVLYNETTALTDALVVNPFFSVMPQFTSHERKQWIRSRQGTLFGWALFFTVLSKYSPRCTFLCVILSKISLAYLITKVSDRPPQGKNLLNWASSQIVWSKEARNHVLNGDFVNDFGFYSFQF